MDSHLQTEAFYPLRRLCIVGGTLIVIIFLLVVLFAGSKVTTSKYNDRTLRYWLSHLELLTTTNTLIQNKDAVIQDLLQLLQIPSNKSKFFWRESLKRVRIVRYIDESGKDYHSLAVRGFQILGTNALNASEDLLTLLNNGYPPDSIIQSIAYLGESTYPIIEKLLEHKDPNIRRNALTVLFMYPCRKPEVEDAVRRAIRDPDYTVRNMADVVREHLGIQTESFKNAKPLRPEI